jgi:Domain of unknown function (DUF4345)
MIVRFARAQKRFEPMNSAQSRGETTSYSRQLELLQSWIRTSDGPVGPNLAGSYLLQSRLAWPVGGQSEEHPPMSRLPAPDLHPGARPSADHHGDREHARRARSLYRSLGLPEAPVFDSNLRFFGGVWLGLGLAMLWTVPHIEQYGTLFRWLWVAVFLGGIGRLVSWLAVGRPPAPYVGFILLEILGAPLFIYWQWRVARG